VVKPRLSIAISEKNLRKRRYYCLENKDIILEEDVLYTDETMFELNRLTIKVFKFKKDSMPEVEKLSSWVRQMVWGGISYRGKTEFLFIDGWINNFKYVGLLKNARRNILDLYPNKYYFLQDNARPHIHKHSLRYIRRWISPNIKDHPPQSPDLNPIELVWGKLKNMVEAKRPKDKNELRKAILECWNEIPLSFIRACIQGLPKRMEKALEDAESQLPDEDMEIEEYSDDEAYDSFGDEYDLEDISSEDYDSNEDN